MSCNIFCSTAEGTRLLSIRPNLDCVLIYNIYSVVTRNLAALHGRPVLLVQDTDTAAGFAMLKLQQFKMVICCLEMMPSINMKCFVPAQTRRIEKYILSFCRCNHETRSSHVKYLFRYCLCRKTVVDGQTVQQRG